MAENRADTPRIDWDRLIIFRRAATESQWQLLNEACRRANMYVDQFILQAGIVEAQRTAPDAWQLPISVMFDRNESKLLREAAERCDSSLADFVRGLALAEARRLVPADCQPHVGDVETPLPGLFSEKKGGGGRAMPRKKRGRRSDPPRKVNRKVTVSFTPGQMEAVSRAAHKQGLRVGDFLREIGTARAYELNSANGDTI